MADPVMLAAVLLRQRTRRVVCVAFAAGLIAWAAASARGAPAQPAAPRRAAARATFIATFIEGTVKGSDGKPVEQAIVLAEPSDGQWISDEPALVARTDASGRFEGAPE